MDTVDVLDNNGNDVDVDIDDDVDDGDNQPCDPDIACRMTLKRNILLILLLLLLLLLILLPIFVLYFLTNDAVRIVLATSTKVNKLCKQSRYDRFVVQYAFDYIYALHGIPYTRHVTKDF